jgi:hypothetical protein
MTDRRFPPPWTVEKIPGGLKVCDANGQSLAYVYSRETSADARIAGVLTEDEARRIASNIAKLPAATRRHELVGFGRTLQNHGQPTLVVCGLPESNKVTKRSAGFLRIVDMEYEGNAARHRGGTDILPPLPRMN